MSLAVAATVPKTSGTRFVSKQEFDAHVEQGSRPREGCIFLTTSDGDIRQIEELLGVPADSLQNHNFSIQTEQSHCTSRQYIRAFSPQPATSSLSHSSAPSARPTAQGWLFAALRFQSDPATNKSHPLI